MQTKACNKLVLGNGSEMGTRGFSHALLQRGQLCWLINKHARIASGTQDSGNLIKGYDILYTYIHTNFINPSLMRLFRVK